MITNAPVLIVLIPLATALLTPVSYTHLDVYKRQRRSRQTYKNQRP